MANRIAMNRVLEPFHERLQVSQALIEMPQVVRLPSEAAGSRQGGEALSQTHQHTP